MKIAALLATTILCSHPLSAKPKGREFITVEPGTWRSESVFTHAIWKDMLYFGGGAGSTGGDPRHEMEIGAFLLGDSAPGRLHPENPIVPRADFDLEKPGRGITPLSILEHDDRLYMFCTARPHEDLRPCIAVIQAPVSDPFKWSGFRIVIDRPLTGLANHHGASAMVDPRDPSMVLVHFAARSEKDDYRILLATVPVDRIDDPEAYRLVRDFENPVLVRKDAKANYPFVRHLPERGLYELWYSGQAIENTAKRACFVTWSEDPASFEPANSSVVVPSRDPTRNDAAYATGPKVHGDHLYYSGRQLARGNYRGIFRVPLSEIDYQPPAPSPTPTTRVAQITHGPSHHFFGYIGHVGNTPWSGDDSKLLALRTRFQDRMPGPEDSAEIVLLDPSTGYAATPVETTRAWNFQQGTMLYWDPAAPDTQFFFNDRDPETNEVFCVHYDLAKKRRLREFRFPGSSIGNGGVAQKGGFFYAINYGRLARVRPVTGYKDAANFTTDLELQPATDGVFRVEIDSGKKTLLVSFARLAEILREDHPEIDEHPLFINHTLANPDNSRVFFFARARFGTPHRIDVPFTMNPDGSDLRRLSRHIGGHPEWLSPTVLIGADGDRQALFDIEKNEITRVLGTPEIFPKPGGDVSISPDRKWLINGHSRGGRNYYTFHNMDDGRWTRTDAFEQGRHHPDLRVDPGPCWNRSGEKVMVVAQDPAGTRQMFLIHFEPGLPKP